MAVPLIATAPSGITVPAASMVTTVPPVTSNDTRPVMANTATSATSAARTAPGTNRIRQILLPTVYSSRVPVHLVQHPIAQDALLSLRDRATPPHEFRRLTRRLSLLLAIEATRRLP